MNKLKARWPLVSRLLSIAASVGGLVGLPFAILPFEKWSNTGYALLAVSAAFLVIFTILEVSTEKGRRVYAKSDERGIRDYMYSWIELGGPVAVWTRNHSWVNDDKMRKLLMDKAREKELTICVPALTPFCKELETAGADVVVHDFSDLSIRFTITNYNKATFSVALARPNAHVHVIEEYESEHPVAALAKDLVELAKTRRVQAS